MSNVMVYVFLLDNIAGFKNALNETIIKNTPTLHSNFIPVIRQCDSITTNQILNAVTRELNAEIIPIPGTFDTDSSSNEALNDTSQDVLFNTLLASSLPEEVKDEFITTIDDSLENISDQQHRRTFNFGENINNVTDDKCNDKVTKCSDAVQHKLNTSSIAEKDGQNEKKLNLFERSKGKEKNNNVTEEVTNTTTTELDFPKSAPFLVAIFETLSNVTAQTCAGTLIAPNWVLTGANCVNILSNLYANDTNMTDSQSVYTVVAGAIDPLLDGSAHNVTAVLQHQGFTDNSTRNRKSVHVEIGPFLAMMRIEPEFEEVGLPMMEEKLKQGDVMIYGWILTKSDSGLDTLNLVIMPALILSTAECQAMYSFNSYDVICLFNNNTDTNVTQLSSGGPVLAAHGGEVKLLAVLQSDERVLVAYPLHMHLAWINSVLDSKL